MVDLYKPEQWRIMKAFDQSNRKAIFDSLLKVTPFNYFLKSPSFYRNACECESEILYYLHPMFTVGGVDFCPYRLLEITAQHYLDKHGSFPKDFVLFSTAIDATMRNAGAIAGTEAITPYWGRILPHGSDTFAYDDRDDDDDDAVQMEANDYLPFGIYKGGDSLFSISANCSRLIDFHDALSKDGKLTLHLSDGAHEVEVVRTLCVDGKTLEQVCKDKPNIANCCVCVDLTPRDRMDGKYFEGGELKTCDIMHKVWSSFVSL